MPRNDQHLPDKKRPGLGELGFSGFIATGAWVGLSPVAPGTIGALWGLPLAWLISLIPYLAVQILVTVVLIAMGIPLCTAAAKRFARKDPGAIVWDEIASMPITFFLVPTERLLEPSVLLAGFLLHRFFDITKIPPARQLERWPEGLGIMADDCVAGAYSCALLHGLIWTRVLPL